MGLEKNLSQKQEHLLLIACKDNGGILKASTAHRMYSGNQGKEALRTLKIYDYIEQVSPGVFEVQKLPTELKEELRHMLDDDSGDESKEDVADSGGSEFEVEEK